MICDYARTIAVIESCWISLRGCSKLKAGICVNVLHPRGSVCPSRCWPRRGFLPSKRTEARLRSFDVPLVGLPAGRAGQPLPPGIKLAEARDKPSSGASFLACEQLLNLPGLILSSRQRRLTWIACCILSIHNYASFTLIPSLFRGDYSSDHRRRLTAL